jgi:polyphosphate kinase 2 (PPK2 family)
MSLSALSKAIKSCDEFVKKGKTAEDRKLRKEACQPTIDDAVRAVENLTKEQRKLEKKLEKEAAKHAKKLEKEAAKQQAKEEKYKARREKMLVFLERTDSLDRGRSGAVSEYENMMSNPRHAHLRKYYGEV